MIHQQFIEAENTLDRAVIAARQFCGPADRIALQNAQWIVRTARSAAQTLCDPQASKEDRSHAFDQLATLFSYV